MRKIASKLPEWLKKPLRKIRGMRFYINGKFCPLCGETSRQFDPFGLMLRENAQCPRCGALERHRLLWLFLHRKTNFFDGEKKRMLHVAPEGCFESRFSDAIGQGYLTADLYSPRAMVRMDITDIQYPDESFDLIYCSHVLEHVLDDIKAMTEFRRVLKSDGWAILLVPVLVEKTYEDESIVDPEERLKAFGQSDHVRKYGNDYIDRLRQSGFTVEQFGVSDLVNDTEAIRMGLTHRASGNVFYCTK